MSKSIHEAEIPACFTADYFENVLRNFFKDDCVKVKNYYISPGSAVGDNYLCQVLRVELEYTRKTQNEKRSLIAKILPKTELSLEIKKNFDVVGMEMKMMAETLPLLYKELRAKVETEPFFPYSYQSDVENSIIFMEDLKVDGYVLADRKSSLDLDHSLLVIKTMAKMHASSFIFLQKNPDYKNDYLEIFWRRSEGALPWKPVEASYDYLLKYLHLWSISEEDKNIFRSYQGNFSQFMTETCRRSESGFNALIHGDFWTANMMFKYENGDVRSVKFLDYQLCNYNSIGLDIVHFLFTSAKNSVKIDHLDDIIKAYYETFVSVTGEIEGFAIETVWNEFKERLPFGFIFALTLRCCMIADEGFDLDAVVQGIESSGNDEMFSNKEFISEVLDILPIFKKYGVFKPYGSCA